MLELWANDPNALAPRLEEVVVLAKEWERITTNRVEAGADRLVAEGFLWEAKNAKPGGR